MSKHNPRRKTPCTCWTCASNRLIQSKNDRNNPEEVEDEIITQKKTKYTPPTDIEENKIVIL